MKHKFEAIEMVNKNSDKAREKEQKKIINRIKKIFKQESGINGNEEIGY